MPQTHHWYHPLGRSSLVGRRYLCKDGVNTRVSHYLLPCRFDILYHIHHIESLEQVAYLCRLCRLFGPQQSWECAVPCHTMACSSFYISGNWNIWFVAGSCGMMVKDRTLGCMPLCPPVLFQNQRI